MPSTKENAINGIATSINLHRVARAKIDDVIAKKKFLRQNVDKERSEKSSLSRKISNLRDLKVELEAASNVVSAPTVGEIAEVNGLIREINELALAEAMQAAGLQFIQSAVSRAKILREQVAFG